MSLFDGRDSFYQYDTNQKLICDSSEIGEEIHFSNNYFATAAIRRTYELEGKIVVDVPNTYLQTSGELIVYRVKRNGTERSTIGHRMFKVIPRKKPADYEWEDNPGQGGDNGGETADTDNTTAILGVAKLGNMKLA